MFVDQYVYVYGAPDSTVWSQDGLSTGLLTVQPRNRPPGMIASEQAFVGATTHVVKTSLPSLRSMTLRFTDSRGNIVKVDEEYVVKLLISF